MSRSYKHSQTNRFSREKIGGHERQQVKKILSLGEEPELSFVPVSVIRMKKEKFTPNKKSWHEDRRRSILDEEQFTS